MGAAKVAKLRKCRKCGAEKVATAAQIKDHAAHCNGSVVSRILRAKVA